MDKTVSAITQVMAASIGSAKVNFKHPTWLQHVGSHSKGYSDSVGRSLVRAISTTQIIVAAPGFGGSKDGKTVVILNFEISAGMKSG
ncbi:hypothetical protein Vi05172_g3621 [Venturia inaequalis]|nr:hypothetical protein Vi05172_g3621 [Venturia inaequalis]